MVAAAAAAKRAGAAALEKSRCATASRQQQTGQLRKKVGKEEKGNVLYQGRSLSARMLRRERAMELGSGARQKVIHLCYELLRYQLP